MWSESARFARRLRGREPLVGCWVAGASAANTERLARLDYDYVGLDTRRGPRERSGWQAVLRAMGARGGPAGMIRVPPRDLVAIGEALNAGARAVLVPAIETPYDAAAAGGACRYRLTDAPPARARRITQDLSVACVVTIETMTAVDRIAEICAVPEIDAVCVGPALEPAHPDIVRAAADTGIGCGVHCGDDETAARRLNEGFTFVTVVPGGRQPRGEGPRNGAFEAGGA